MNAQTKIDDKTARLTEIADFMASVTEPDGTEGFGNLNPQQRKFAVAFCLTGGNACRAAEIADYAHPKVAGHKLRLNPKVSELIRVLALADAGSCLPVAIATLIDIAEDKGAKPETRRNAALDLAKIAQAMPTGAPSVAVQVNNGPSASTTAGDAPTLVIQNVWKNREEREMSSIAPPMPDTSQQVIEHRETDRDDDG